MEQGQQTITIQYVGETPNDPQLLGIAATAALSVIAKHGYFVNTKVNPTVHNFTETDVAQMVAMIANKSKTKGVTIKVENTTKPVLNREDGEKLIRTIKSLFDV